MPTYLHPGVYVEEIPSGARPIEGVSTSTAAFVGYTTKGPLNEPVLIFNFDDYVGRFGGLRDRGGAASEGDAMGFSVRAFFQNGGTRAYVVRLAEDGGQGSKLVAAGAFLPLPGDPSNLLSFTAVDEGTWGDGLVVRVTPKPSDTSLHRLEIGRLDRRGRFSLLEAFADVSLDDTSPRFILAAVNGVSELVEVAIEAASAVTIPEHQLLPGRLTGGDLTAAPPDLSGANEAARTLELTVTGGGSSIFDVVVPAEDFSKRLPDLAAAIQREVRESGVALRRTAFTAGTVDGSLVLTSGSPDSSSSVSAAAGALATLLKLTDAEGAASETGQERFDASTEATLGGGGDGQPAAASAYAEVFLAFEKIRDISILCLPGRAWDSDGKPAIEGAIAHAEKMKNRMVIVDPPVGSELVTESEVNDLGLPTSTYTVLYYPWLRVANPFHDAEDNPGAPMTLRVPPCGYAAGMWSKIDGRRGVWKAPAGVETALLGLAAAEFVVEDVEQDQLNPLGVNALRRLPGFGHVVWGSRTLATRADPEWRYVPVRRTAIFVEQSIYNGIQWAVFEPNDHRLWSSLRLNIESFMDGLFRSGAFQGQKASDAYFVRCGLGDTMTQGDVDRGQVIVIVGFAPLKPAEFVIVRIQQMVAQQ